MSREIKFRAYVKFLNEVQAVTEMKLNGNVFVEDYFYALAQDDVYLMQYTGLKDKNGVEVYEGDIVEAWGNNLEVKYIVDGFFAESPCGLICEAGQEWDGACIVIGNTHQNPELLK